MATFAVHLTEEGGEAVVILLTPFFERVVMALRALQSHAEEKLRGVLQFRLRLAHVVIPGDGRIVFNVTRSAQQLAHEPVVWLVLQQAVAHPGVKGVSAPSLLR